MFKITVKIEGMMCPMCEAHVNDAIRGKFSVKEVKSSHKAKETVIITEHDLDNESVTATVTAMGYTVLGITKEPYEKKGIFAAFKRK